jgi:hypothetical protein
MDLLRLDIVIVLLIDTGVGYILMYRVARLLLAEKLHRKCPNGSFFALLRVTVVAMHSLIVTPSLLWLR